jgi:hypothetical protein
VNVKDLPSPRTEINNIPPVVFDKTSSVKDNKRTLAMLKRNAINWGKVKQKATNITKSSKVVRQFRKGNKYNYLKNYYGSKETNAISFFPTEVKDSKKAPKSAKNKGILKAKAEGKHRNCARPSTQENKRGRQGGYKKAQTMGVGIRPSTQDNQKG